MARNHYSPELIASLVQQVLQDQQPLTHVARDQGIHPGVLSKWVKRRRIECEILRTDTPMEDTAQMKERIHILEERVETLRGVVEKLLRERYK